MIAVIVSLILGLAALFLAPRAWRGQLTFDPGRPPGWWVWGGPLWRGWVRTTFWVCAMGWLFPVLALVAGVVSSEDPLPSGLHVPGWYLALFVGWLGGFLAGIGSIVLFSRPKVLIPPRYRGQSGAIKEWSRGTVLRRK